MDAKAARAWASTAGEPCPQCGARITVCIETTEAGQAAFAELADAGYVRRIAASVGDGGDPCPSCGVRLTLTFETSARGLRALARIEAAGYRRSFVPIEEAEEDLRRNDFEFRANADPRGAPAIGGRVR